MYLFFDGNNIIGLFVSQNLMCSLYLILEKNELQQFLQKCFFLVEVELKNKSIL